MGARGVHFALDDLMADRLLGAAGNDGAVMDLIEEIEEGELYSAGGTYGTDKAWDAIHRALTDGELGYRNGSYPLNAAILGGRQLHREDDYIVSYLSPDQVRDVAGALGTVDQAALREGYLLIDAEEYGQLGDEDFGYTWENFTGLTVFFGQAAQAGQHVIFTVDQ
jgi:hypothetical protein